VWNSFLKDDRRNFVLRIVLQRDIFNSFYIVEWKINFWDLSNEHNEFDWRLFNKKKWDVVDSRQFCFLRFRLTNAIMFASSIVKFFAYCAFCFNVEHLTNAFLMLEFFASIALWKRKTLISDVIVLSTIITLLDFWITKKSFKYVNFFVSNEMSLNDCVDRLDEDKFQHNVNLFVFVKDYFLQLFHVNNFFCSQFKNFRCICIN
jgi:hypothetical protein